MAKQLKDILKGVKASKVVPGSTGSDPGVDYAPKAPDEQEFVKKHATEKHADRVGNGDDVYQATNVKHSLAKPGEERHGHKKPKDKNVYEAAKCNMTEAGTACPVHEMADCTKKTLKEVLTKKTPAGEWIKDFQKSKDPKFAGKTPEKRKKMALAAYYDKQRNEEVDVTEEKHFFHVHMPADDTRGHKMVDDKTSEPMGAKPKGHKLKITVPGDRNTATNKAAKYVAKNYGTNVKFTYGGKISESLAVPLIGSADDDESAEMAKTQLRALANKAMHLALQLSDDQMVEPWVQSKIALAKDYVTSVHDYMLYGEKEPKKEQTAPYDGSIDMSGAPRNTMPSFSADVNTGRVV